MTLQQCDARSSLELIELIQPQLAQLAVPASHMETPASPARTLLLTGATGFLGAHLLSQLLAADSFDTIHAVVRQPEKLSQQFCRFGLGPFPADRVEFIVGDLTELAAQALPDVDVVLHGAALLHGLHPLSRMWANVETTYRLCRRYGCQPATRLAFISSLSVFVSSTLQGEHLPRPLPLREDYSLIGGYAQSKYLGEQLVGAVRGDVIRPGLLTGSSFLGQFPENDFFTLLMQTLIKLGVCPEGYDEAFVDITPVDFAAQRIIPLLQRPRLVAERGIEHVANRNSLALSQIVSALELQPVSKDEFFRVTQGLPRLTQVLLHYAFFKQEALTRYPRYFNIDLFQSTGHRYGITAPFAMDNERLLERYVQAAYQESYCHV